MFFSRLKQRISDQYKLLKWLYVNAHKKDLVLFADGNIVQNLFFRKGRFIANTEQLNILKRGLDQHSCDSIDLWKGRNN